MKNDLDILKNKVLKDDNNPENIYAYDIAENVISQGEILNINALEQAFENIISISFGEVLFHNEKGTTLYETLFSNINSDNKIDTLKDDIRIAINNFDDRLSVSKNDIKIELDENTLNIKIVYYITSFLKLKNVFQKSIKI